MNKSAFYKFQRALLLVNFNFGDRTFLVFYDAEFRVFELTFILVGRTGFIGFSLQVFYFYFFIVQSINFPTTKFDSVAAYCKYILLDHWKCSKKLISFLKGRNFVNLVFYLISIHILNPLFFFIIFSENPQRCFQLNFFSDSRISRRNLIHHLMMILHMCKPHPVLMNQHFVFILAAFVLINRIYLID